jgi:hypothetical protein
MSVDVERALRRALAARAAQITPERLQPAVPPTAMPARRSASSFAGRFRWLVVTGVAVLLVAVAVAVHPPGLGPKHPVPERPASSVRPSPSPSASVSPSRLATPSAASPVPASPHVSPHTLGPPPHLSPSAHP